MRRILEVGARRIDLDSGEVEGVGVLRPIERAVLAYLAEHQDRAVSIHELHTHVWGYAPAVNSRAAYSTINRLRPAIEPDPAAPRFLTAERGEGYRLRDARIVTRGVERLRTNLRPPSDRFFGREAETERLRATRGTPITVVGPAGVGKTRWVLEAGASIDPWGGVWVCELDGCLDRADLLSRVARAIPGAPSADPGAIAASLSALGACWLVLDGAERVPDVLPGVLATLAARSPAATWVVTSRQRLGVPAET
ncbi:MAG: winged helix-turn-helix domain-containing protein, partial [Myxococcota bacterium]